VVSAATNEVHDSHDSMNEPSGQGEPIVDVLHATLVLEHWRGKESAVKESWALSHGMASDESTHTVCQKKVTYTKWCFHYVSLKEQEILYILIERLHPS
jgi:hypothetical protein